MSGISAGPVVVGYDGSATSRVALMAAATEAERRRAALRVVHGLGVRPYEEVFPEGAVVQDHLPWRRAAEESLAEAAQAVVEAHPGLDVSTCVRMAAPTVLLLQESHGAQLLVVGARGNGGFPGLTVGSVAAHLTSHARCPVLVAHPDVDPSLPVAVGVDGSESCMSAIAFAFDAADLRGVGLTAVHSYQPWAYDPAVDAHPEEEADIVTEHAALVSEALAGWGAKYPDVQTRVVIRRGQPASALIRETTAAQLVVVGSRGRGGFRGMLLGSVSRAVVHHAGCTVVVVRPPAGH